MATIGPLAGAGLDYLSPGLSGIKVGITVFPPSYGVGRANPSNYYDIGMLRFETLDGVYPAIPIDATVQFIPVPPLYDRIGYSLRPGVVITIIEVFGDPLYMGPPGPTGPAGAVGSTGPAGASGSTLISDQLVTGSVAATIDFTSLGTYLNLILRWQARGDVVGGATSMYMRFNSDSGSNYDFNVVAMNNALNGSVSSAQAQFTAGAIGGTTSPANSADGGTIVIPNYRGTTWWKNFFAEQWRIDAASGSYQQIASGNWRNTGAITGIRLYPQSGNFLVNSRFMLVGEQ